MSNIDFSFNAKELGLTKNHLDTIWFDITGNGALDAYNIRVQVESHSGWSKPTVTFEGRDRSYLNVRGLNSSFNEESYVAHVKSLLRDVYIEKCGWIEQRIQRAYRDVVDEFSDRGFLSNTTGVYQVITDASDKPVNFQIMGLVSSYVFGDLDEEIDSIRKLENNNVLHYPQWVRPEVLRFAEVAKRRLEWLTGSKGVKSFVHVMKNYANEYTRSVVIAVDDVESIYHGVAVGFMMHPIRYFDMDRLAWDPKFVSMIKLSNR